MSDLDSNPNRLPCPIEGCGGSIEANPKIYLQISTGDNGPIFSVYGVQEDELTLTCDWNGHDVTDELLPVYKALGAACSKLDDAWSGMELGELS